MNFAASSDYHGDGRYLQRCMVKQNINKLMFSPEDSVLDVGCGSGEETKCIATKVGNVTGIDTSDEMLTMARKNNLAPNITYCKWDAQTVGDNPDWQGRFDKVVCLFVLNWIDDKSKAFTSILHCLKPGGEALFLIGHRDTFLSSLVLFLNSHTKWADYIKGYKSALHLWSRSIGETEELLAKYGWTNVQCEVQSYATSSEEQTKLFIKTILGQTARVPVMEQESYLEDVWQWMLSRYEDESQAGSVRLPIEAMMIHACKPLKK